MLVCDACGNKRKVSEVDVTVTDNGTEVTAYDCWEEELHLCRACRKKLWSFLDMLKMARPKDDEEEFPVTGGAGPCPDFLVNHDLPEPQPPTPTTFGELPIGTEFTSDELDDRMGWSRGTRFGKSDATTIRTGYEVPSWIKVQPLE